MTWKIVILLLAYFSATATPAHLKETVAVSFNETQEGGDGYLLQIQSGNKQHSVHLRKRDPLESVLYDGLNVLTADVDDEENLILEPWLPSQDELRLAEDIYIDEKLKAAIRIEDMPLGQKQINGVINDYSILYKDGVGHQTFRHHETIPETPKTDDDEKFSPDNDSQVNAANDPGENVVELLIVCDKDFGDHFNQDRKKILDYWTVFMWDINLRFKTLKSTKISFQVVGIVVIKNKKAQPFIEEARLSNGRAEHGRLLNKFSAWVYEKRDLLPKFDMAVIVEKTEMEWSGGRAFMKGPCRIDEITGTQMNTLSFNDDGNWNSVTLAAHYMGHSLGSPDDEEGGCKERGFIMSDNPNPEYKWFFSSCSDKAISAFVKTETAACLKTKENKRIPILSPEFDSPLALSMDAQCKLLTGNDQAYVEKNDKFNNTCKDLRCVVRSEDDDDTEAVKIFNFPTVDNTICGDDKEERRCFRGRCRLVGYLLKNVATGLCMRARNPYYPHDGYEMVPCPRYGTPLDRLVMQSIDVDIVLSSPFHQKIQNQVENDDKCAFAGKGANGMPILSDRCGRYTSDFIVWELRYAGNSTQFLMMHKKTGRFARPESKAIGSPVKVYDDDDSINKDEFKWTRSL